MSMKNTSSALGKNMVITYTEKLQKGKIFSLLKIDIYFSNSDRFYSVKSSALTIEKYSPF